MEKVYKTMRAPARAASQLVSHFGDRCDRGDYVHCLRRTAVKAQG